MNNIELILKNIDSFVWGPIMLMLLVGTGIFLTIKTRFLPWKNLGYAIKSVLSKEAMNPKNGSGDISPFSALTTSLAATMGTGNIVGVATAMVLGGPGALVWMCLAALFGLTTTFSECMLSYKYRSKNKKGQIIGGPMYTMKKAFKHKRLGAFLGMTFAVFTAISSFGIGNLTQSNSISTSLQEAFNIPLWISGIIIAGLSFIILVGGIKSISRVSQVVVPFMACFYMIGSIIVILGNFSNLPRGIYVILESAFSFRSLAGGVGGFMTTSIMKALRWGVARGVFTNEAGLGSSGITACAAVSDSHVRQGYINMTGTFFDTIIVCTITGLVIASSGMLGVCDSTGSLITGVNLTIAAFSTVLGDFGGAIVSMSITLFAFATILGWEYEGEKSFEYIVGTHKLNIIYRILFALMTFVGATTSLEIVWSFSDIANALMAIPNLICLLALSSVIAKDTKEFERIIKKEKRH